MNFKEKITGLAVGLGMAGLISVPVKTEIDRSNAKDALDNSPPTTLVVFDSTDPRSKDAENDRTFDLKNLTADQRENLHSRLAAVTTIGVADMAQFGNTLMVDSNNPNLYNTITTVAGKNGAKEIFR